MCVVSRDLDLFILHYLSDIYYENRVCRYVFSIGEKFVRDVEITSMDSC